MVKLSSLHTYGTQLCRLEPSVVVIMHPTCNTDTHRWARWLREHGASVGTVAALHECLGARN